MNAIQPCLECPNECCTEQGQVESKNQLCPIVVAAKTMLELMAAGQIPGMAGANGPAEGIDGK